MKQNRSHLIPTAITNKNGVQTTVHKKPASASTSNTKLPTPTLPVTTIDRQQLERDTATALVHQNSGPPTSEADAAIRSANYHQLLRVLPSYSDETLQRFTNTSTTDLGWALNEYLCNTTGDKEEYINDWITVEPTALECDIDSVPLIQGLNRYPHLEPQKNGHYPPRRAEQAIAITRVTAHFSDTNNHGVLYDVNDQHSTVKYIADYRLRELLTTHEDPTAIADLIVTRNLTDPDQITALYDTLNTTAKAINNGVL